jgi:predicted dehydrogenase
MDELTPKPILQKNTGRNKIRYGVVGLGYISQVAVLPAFEHARKNCELTALVSHDPVKLKKLGQKYGVEYLCSYADYDDLLHSGEIDAVYIALPNSMHAEYTIRAARAGIHVLCETPMAVTEDECRQMISACEENNVRLMIAYRLHFEEANMRAVEIVKSGKIGTPRFFASEFSMQVRPGNIRTSREMGGGSVYDIGIYCINAARYIFQEEPVEVLACSAAREEDRFREIDEMSCAIMRFPGQKLASFTSCFGAGDVSTFDVVGTLGNLRLEQAYEMTRNIIHKLTIEGRTKQKTFLKRDQFAPELVYFSNCVLGGEDPEPSGWEGLADVRVIRAIYESAKRGTPVKLEPFNRYQRPSLRQEMRRPPVSTPTLVDAETPSVS